MYFWAPRGSGPWVSVRISRACLLLPQGRSEKRRPVEAPIRGNTHVVRSTSPGSEPPAVRSGSIHWRRRFTAVPLVVSRLHSGEFSRLRKHRAPTSLWTPVPSRRGRALQRNPQCQRREGALCLQPLVRILARRSCAQPIHRDHLGNSRKNRSLQLRSSSDGFDRNAGSAVVPDPRLDCRRNRSRGLSRSCNGGFFRDGTIHSRGQQHIQPDRHLVRLTGNHLQHRPLPGTGRCDQHICNCNRHEQRRSDQVRKSFRND
jgi:hypothetical protein